MANIFELFRKIESETAAAAKPISYLIVGLGNPGKEYERTRHNAGFRAVENLRRSTGAAVERARFDALCSEGTLGGHGVLFLRPQTYMNLSGKAVAAAAEFYKIPPERILVVYDDISLDVGHLRVRRSGSAGGHNGIKSIIAHLSSEKFPRIKIGIGKKPHPAYDLADWVLSKFTEAEEKALVSVFDCAAQAAGLICEEKIEQAMNIYNRSGD